MNRIRTLFISVSFADNYEWWIKDGKRLAAEVDFLGVHTYPAWEGKGIDEGLEYTVQNIRDVYAALPDKPIAILAEKHWDLFNADRTPKHVFERQTRH